MEGPSVEENKENQAPEEHQEMETPPREAREAEQQIERGSPKSLERSESGPPTKSKKRRRASKNSTRRRESKSKRQEKKRANKREGKKKNKAGYMAIIGILGMVLKIDPRNLNLSIS